MKIVTNFTHSEHTEKLITIGCRAVGKNYPHPLDAWLIGYLQACVMVHEAIIQSLKEEDPELTVSGSYMLDAFAKILPPEVQFFTKEDSNAAA